MANQKFTILQNELRMSHGMKTLVPPRSSHVNRMKARVRLLALSRKYWSHHWITVLRNCECIFNKEQKNRKRLSVYLLHHSILKRFSVQLKIVQCQLSIIYAVNYNYCILTIFIHKLTNKAAISA